MTRAALAVGLSALVYPLALASFHPWDIAFGLVLAAGLVAGLRRHLLPGDGPSGRSLAARALWLPVFAAAAAREVVLGAWQVALVVLGIRPLRRPGIVVVPFGERTSTGVAATALVLTLSPGEVLVELDERRRALVLHVLDASDPDAVRRRHERFYERYQRRVFP